MSAFANVLYGPEQEVYNTYTDRRWMLGTKLILQDGRMFRFCLAGGTTLAPGKVCQSPANVANHILQTPATAGVVGDTSLSVTLGATAMTADQYRDGIMSVNLGTGFGYSYALDTHAAVGSGAATGSSLKFKRGVSLQKAVPTTANSVSFIANPYSNSIVYPTTPTGAPIGVPMVSITNAQYGWLQTRGLSTVLTNGTVVIGDAVVTSATTAGAVDPTTSTFAVVYLNLVGFVQVVATSTNYSTIQLTIE